MELGSISVDLSVVGDDGIVQPRVKSDRHVLSEQKHETQMTTQKQLMARILAPAQGWSHDRIVVVPRDWSLRPGSDPVFVHSQDP